MSSYFTRLVSIPTTEQMTHLCGPESNHSRKLSIVAGSLAVLLVIIVLAVTLSISTKNEDVAEPLGDSMSRLRKDLFKDYDKLIIPGTGPRTPVEMAFGLALINIDMNKDGTVVIDTWLRSVWNDYRLQWDPSDYGNVSVLRLPADQLWMPDIALYNSKGLTESDRNTHILGISDVNYLVYPNGEVLHIPPVTLKAHCFNSTSHGLQQDWPWGQHECKFKFGSWTYDGFGINLTAFNVCAVLMTEAQNRKKGDCNWAGARVCNGSVQKDFGTGKARVCENNQYVTKSMDDIKAGGASMGADCMWAGEVKCNGEIFRDLFRWWFVQRCHNGKLREVLAGRTVADILQDPRYPGTLGRAAPRFGRVARDPKSRRF